ncbi:unnamed protein product [Urochloa humidicola]
MATHTVTRALYAAVSLLLLIILDKHVPAQAAFPYRSLLQTCQPSGSIAGRSGDCNTENGSECCKDGQRYTTYACSPRVMGSTRALLTLNSFAEGGDGGSPAACTGKYYDDGKTVVALSTGWYGGGGRCRKHVVIRAASNGRTVRALVVDECDSTVGCDKEHNFEPPCRNNIVDGSPAVWDALGLNKDDGQAQITWSDE